MSSTSSLRISKSEIRYRIDDLFREANITIAFPQRDVHIDSLSPLQVRLLRETTPEERERERLVRQAEEEEARLRALDPKTGVPGLANQSFKLKDDATNDKTDDEIEGDLDKGGNGAAPD